MPTQTPEEELRARLERELTSEDKLRAKLRSELSPEQPQERQPEIVQPTPAQPTGFQFQGRQGGSAGNASGLSPIDLPNVRDLIPAHPGTVEGVTPGRDPEPVQSTNPILDRVLAIKDGTYEDPDKITDELKPGNLLYGLVPGLAERAEEQRLQRKRQGAEFGAEESRQENILDKKEALEKRLNVIRPFMTEDGGLAENITPEALAAAQEFNQILDIPDGGILPTELRPNPEDRPPLTERFTEKLLARLEQMERLRYAGLPGLGKVEDEAFEKFPDLEAARDELQGGIADLPEARGKAEKVTDFIGGATPDALIGMATAPIAVATRAALIERGVSPVLALLGGEAAQSLALAPIEFGSTDPQSAIINTLVGTGAGAGAGLLFGEFGDDIAREFAQRQAAGESVDEIVKDLKLRIEERVRMDVNLSRPKGKDLAGNPMPEPARAELPEVSVSPRGPDEIVIEGPNGARLEVQLRGTVENAPGGPKTLPADTTWTHRVTVPEGAPEGTARALYEKYGEIMKEHGKTKTSGNPMGAYLGEENANKLMRLRLIAMGVANDNPVPPRGKWMQEPIRAEEIPRIVERTTAVDELARDMRNTRGVEGGEVPKLDVDRFTKEAQERILQQQSARLESHGSKLATQAGNPVFGEDIVSRATKREIRPRTDFELQDELTRTFSELDEVNRRFEKIAEARDAGRAIDAEEALALLAARKQLSTDAVERGLELISKRKNARFLSRTIDEINSVPGPMRKANFVRMASEVTTTEQLRELRYIAMLSNPFGRLRDVTGNAANVFVFKPVDIAAGGTLNKLALAARDLSNGKLFGGVKDTLSPEEAFIHVYGALESSPEAMAMIAHSLAGGESAFRHIAGDTSGNFPVASAVGKEIQGAKYDIGDVGRSTFEIRPDDAPGTKALKGVAVAGRKATLDAIVALDDAAKVMASGGTLKRAAWRIAKEEGISLEEAWAKAASDPEVIKEAADYAKHATFQDEGGALLEWFQGMRAKDINTPLGKVRPLGEAVPFVHTRARILSWIGDRFGKAAIEDLHGFVKNGGFENMDAATQREFFENVSKPMTTLMMLTAVGSLVEAGVLTGSAPAVGVEFEEYQGGKSQAKFSRNAGFKPDAALINDRLTGLNRHHPGELATMLADMYIAYSSDENLPEERIKFITDSMWDTVKDSPVEDIQTLFESLADFDGAADIPIDYAESYVPALLRLIADTQDQEEQAKKKTRIEESIGANVSDRIASVTPESLGELGFRTRSDLETREDAFGNPIERKQDLQSKFVGDTGKETTPKKLQDAAELEKLLSLSRHIGSSTSDLVEMEPSKLSEALENTERILETLPEELKQHNKTEARTLRRSSRSGETKQSQRGPDKEAIKREKEFLTQLWKAKVINELNKGNTNEAKSAVRAARRNGITLDWSALRKAHKKAQQE